VVILDTAKGFFPALVFFHAVSPLAGVLAGGAAMLGHARPLFLKFEKGGKMVATTGGAFLGVAPLVGAVGAIVWVVAFLVTRYASVASILSAVALPVAALALGQPWPVVVFAIAAAAAVIFMHRANIGRLLRGEENRFVLRHRGSPRAQTCRQSAPEVALHASGSSGAIVSPDAPSRSQYDSAISLWPDQTTARPEEWIRFANSRPRS